jgi:3-mercaptopropionate dioxygenase
MTQAATTPVIVSLASEIEAQRRPGQPAEVLAGRVAAVLRSHLRQRDWLRPEDQEPDPSAYRQHVLHVAPDGAFSIASLVWLPGQATCIHDHVCWCVVGVYRGLEIETGYRLHDGGGERFLVPKGERLVRPGEVTALVPPEDDIHRVACAGHQTAVSIHVYGTDIGQRGTSIDHRFDGVAIRQEAGAAHPVNWREQWGVAV